MRLVSWPWTTPVSEVVTGIAAISATIWSTRVWFGQPAAAPQNSAWSNISRTSSGLTTPIVDVTAIISMAPTTLSRWGRNIAMMRPHCAGAVGLDALVVRHACGTTAYLRPRGPVTRPTPLLVAQRQRRAQAAGPDRRQQTAEGAERRRPDHRGQRH